MKKDILRSYNQTETTECFDKNGVPLDSSWILDNLEFLLEQTDHQNLTDSIDFFDLTSVTSLTYKDTGLALPVGAKCLPNCPKGFG